jgi:hypothetical protein
MDDVAWWLQGIGYLGSGLVALSFSMSNLRTLRRINLVGASIFATYGLLINAWPVVALNSYIVLTDIWYLHRLNRQRDYFSLLAISQTGSTYMTRFLAFHAEEIGRIFPAFDTQGADFKGWWILRDLQPVGLFVHRAVGEGHEEITCDFVIPAYRDLKTAQWFFEHGVGQLKETGTRALLTSSQDPGHQRYLSRMGFTSSRDGVYRMDL